jgi:hypothetical protein
LATQRRRPRRRNGIDASLIRSGHVPSTPPTDEPSLQDFRAWQPTRLVVLLSLSRCAAAAMGDEEDDAFAVELRGGLLMDHTVRL